MTVPAPETATLSRRGFLTGLLSACAVTRAEPNSRLIPTMTGPVPCTSLGTTLVHEHLLWFGGPGLQHAGYAPIPEELRSESVAFAAGLLNDAAKAGITTVVDVTPHRPIDLYRQIARRTTVKIVPSTGFYRRAKIPASWAAMEDEKAMEGRMHREIAEGIDGTSIRAGVIKVASEGAPLTDWEKKVFRAAGRVQKATGVPIESHSGPKSAPEQHALLVEAGADPRKIVLCHMDVGTQGRAERLEALLPLLKQGSYFEVDTFGQDFYTPWSHLTAFLRSFCDAGFADRLMISIDCNWHWENGVMIFEGAEPPARDPNASRRTYAYMMTFAVPRLLDSGFSKKEIDTFLIGNPRRLFSEL